MRWPLNRCSCGRMPGVRTLSIAGGIVAAWVQCPSCDARGERVEDDHADRETAVQAWNISGGRRACA